MLPAQHEILTRRLSTFPSHMAPHPLPSPRETHFWYVVPDDVKNASILNQYLELLSPCEKQSVLRMKEDKHKKGALLARTLVRTTLARYTNCKVSPRSLKFRKNGFGKPEVVWQHDESWVPPSLHFNLSHTSSLIACGVTVDVPVGIDIEEKQRKLKNDIMSFSRRYFSPQEVEFLRAFSDPESQRQEFIKLWTLKEAYVKALGRGFSAAPFKDFTIRLEASKGMQALGKSDSDASKIIVDACSSSGELTPNWQFALFEVNSHYAAICMEKADKVQGRESNSLNLKVWKTLPLVEDEYVSGTDAVITLSGVS